MRIAIYSDLHLEFEPFSISKTNADVIILAGDISTAKFTSSTGWARQESDRLGGIPIIQIAGNHEFYHGEYSTVLEALKKGAQDSNVHFLENESVVINGVRFVGCTFWSNFMYFNRPEITKNEVHKFLNDYRMIRYKDRLLNPADTQDFCFESAAYLNSLPTFDGKSVLVTHHGLSPKCHDYFKFGEPNDVSLAFWSDCEELLAGFELAIYGHTHSSLKFEVNNTRVVSNQKGYYNECKDFDLNYTVEI